MMVRPRVNLISKTDYYTDISWYMQALRNLNTPTFCINNTVARNWQQELMGQKLEVDDRELLKQVRDKFGNRVHLMVLETAAMS